MALLLRIVVRLLALAGLALYAVEAAAILLDIGLACLVGCDPPPSDFALAHAIMARAWAAVPRNLLPGVIVLAVAWVACLALLLRARRWIWASIVGLVLPLSLGLYVGAIYGVPDGLPQTYAAWTEYRSRHNPAYLVSLLGLLTLVVATFFTRQRSARSAHLVDAALE